MMEFATMCIGKELVFDWKKDVITFNNFKKLNILTDCSEWFISDTYEYKKKEFSYYDKLIFLLDLMESKEKELLILM